MQNQSKFPVDVRYHPVPFPDGYAISEPDLNYRIGNTPVSWMHYHDCLEIGYCYSGAGVFMIDGQILPFGAGTAILIPRGSVHNAHSAPGTDSLWRFLNLDPVRLLRGEMFEALERYASGDWRYDMVLSRPGDEPLADLIRRIIELQIEKPAFYQDGVRGLAKALLALAMGRCTYAPQWVGRGRAVLPAVQYMMEHYGEEIRVERLATQCGLSPSSLRRGFRDAYGMSPGDYLARLRIRMAALALRQSDETVLEIAGRAGYGSVTSFERQFRRIMGETPGRWRRQPPSPG